MTASPKQRKKFQDPAFRLAMRKRRLERFFKQQGFSQKAAKQEVAKLYEDRR